MRYEARLTAYDMLDAITVALVIWESADDELSKPAVVLRTATTLRGVGETDPTEWTRDALVAILETL